VGYHRPGPIVGGATPEIEIFSKNVKNVKSGVWKFYNDFKKYKLFPK
jgi:hypothetical protein